MYLSTWLSIGATAALGSFFQVYQMIDYEYNLLTMNHNFFILSILTFGLINAAVITQNSYWDTRAQLVDNEEIQAIGGNLSFEEGERIANDLLMFHKSAELAEAYLDSDRFLPTKNFMISRKDIEKSKVFQIIKKMPKGGVLHGHANAMVSLEWLFNVTFREHLYVCDENDELSVQFMKIPSVDCNWELLSDVRQNSTIVDQLNERLKSEMTMVVDNPKEVYPNNQAAWVKFKKVNNFLTKLLSYRPVYEDHTYQTLKELYEDNVSYIEVRSTFSSIYDFDGKVYSPLEILGIYENVTNRFKKDYPDFIGAKIIFNDLRSKNVSEIKESIDIAIEMKEKHPNSFAGFDLADDEHKGHPNKEFADILNPVKNELNFFFHAAETNWYGTSTDENLIDAVLLNTKRIGHGFGLLKHPQVVNYVKKNNIAMEVCPISNQGLGLVNDLRNHPASVFFAEGIPVVISSDNPVFWGSSGLSYDFYEAFMGIMSAKSDIRALKQLAINSIVYSSLSETEKTAALQLWQTKWNNFINQLNN